MIKQIQFFWEVIKPNLNDFVIEGAIMISSIITLMGILKKFLFNKIKNKLFRKVLLSLTSLIFVGAGTSVKFVIQSLPATHYLCYAIPYMISTIVIYWFYESFGFRDIVHKIGDVTLRKIWELLVDTIKKIFTGKKVDVEKELLNGLDKVKQSITKEIPEYINHDNEIEKL